MNLFELQERLKDFSQDQLVREMQAPTGMAPQYLVLSELQRRQRMMAEEQAQMQTPQTTVAEDAIAAAGVPQGGLADMARAMAPQTDMDMNTAARPVDRMQKGGAILPPRIEDQAEPMSREELAASRRDRLAQDALEEALAMMESSPAGAGRSAISRILQQVYPEGYANVSRMPEDEIMRAPRRMADGGVVRMQPGGLAGISRDLGAYSPTMEGAALSRRMMEEEDARRRRAELAAAMFQYGTGRMPVATGEGQLFDPEESPLLPQAIEPEAGAPPAGTDLRGLGTVISEMVSGEDPEAAATRLLESGQIDQDQYDRYVFGSSGERNRIIRESLGYEEPRPATDAGSISPEVTDLPEIVFDSGAPATEDSPRLSFGDQFPPVDIRRAGNEELSFGGISPTEAALPLALPRGAEEEEQPTPPTGGRSGGVGGGAAAPAMDDAFEQDKWLALAQAGLSLMSSRQPTLGGAIGEAGLAGITALRQARGERDQRIAAQQARADRLAAAAASAARRQNEEAYPYRQVDDLMAMADSYVQAARDIREANFNTVPSEGDPGYMEYYTNIATANALRRRALALTGQE